MGKRMRFFLIFLVVFVLDISAAIFGWTAQVAQNQHMKFGDKKPCQDVYDLGLASASLLVIVHVFATFVVVYGLRTHVSTGGSSSLKWASIVFHVFTWFLMVCGLSVLAQGVLSICESRATCGFSDNRSLYQGGWACIYHALSAFATFVCISPTADHHRQPEEDTEEPGRAIAEKS